MARGGGKKGPARKGREQKGKKPFAALPAALDIKKIGRPSKYDPSFCDLVLELGAQGKSKAQIAALIGVTRPTIDSWCAEHPEFLYAIKAATDLSLAWWETLGQTNVVRPGFNAAAFIFQMHNRFRADYRRDAKEAATTPALPAEQVEPPVTSAADDYMAPLFKRVQGRLRLVDGGKDEPKRGSK